MEIYYFYIDKNGAQRGPLSLKQLIAENISPSTLIWHDGVIDWKRADQFMEVQYELELLKNRNIVPPVPPTNFAPLYNTTEVSTPSYVLGDAVIERPKKWVIEAVLVTVLCCMPMGIVALIYALRAEDNWNAGAHKEALSASKSAGIWVKVSLFAVILYPLLYIILLTLGLMPLMFM